MAHNLNTNKKSGKVAFASGNGKVAWHGLGQVVEGMMTSQEAIKLAQLDYEVGKFPIFANIGGQQFEVPNNFGTFRLDTNENFGVVGNVYQIVQNRDAFGFFDNLVGEGAAIYETAGALGIGEKIFITAKMPKDIIRIGGTDDVTETYVVLTSSHDGSGSIIAMVTNVRVVCQNTLNQALRNSTNKVKIRHTKNVHAALQQAHELLGITHVLTRELNECFNMLAKKSVTDTQVKEIANLIFTSKGKKEEESTRITNLKDKFFQAYYTGIGQEKILGTAWGVYNGVTYYLSHVKEYKNESTMLESLLGGESQKINQIAFDALMTL